MDKGKCSVLYCITSIRTGLLLWAGLENLKFPLKEFRIIIEDFITGDEDIPNELTYNYNSRYSHFETTTSDKQWKKQHSSHHHVRWPPSWNCFEVKIQTSRLSWTIIYTRHGRFPGKLHHKITPNDYTTAEAKWRIFYLHFLLSPYMEWMLLTRILSIRWRIFTFHLL